MLIILLFICFSIGNCDDCNPKLRPWKIMRSFYHNKSLFLLTSDNAIRVYRVQDFNYEVNKKAEITEIFKNNVLMNFKYMFAIEDQVFSIQYKTVEYVRRFICTPVVITGDSVRTLKTFNIDPYTTDPKEDKHNLMSIFAKFPEDQINDNIKAVLSFPSNEKSLPKRFFVYYNEVPTKSAKDKGLTQNKFKRHIFVENSSENKENKWFYDEKSGKCINESFVIDSATRISDQYNRSGDKFTFDIIEFFGTKYSVKRVEVKGERVLRPLVELKKGSVFDLFGCIAEKRTEDKTRREKTTEETTTKSRRTPEDHTSLIRFFIWLIISLFIGAILVILLATAFFYWRKLERRRLRKEAKEAKKAEKIKKTEQNDNPPDNVGEAPKHRTDTETE